jgi:nucleoside 2-deoxyribosyltransferase
MAFEVFLSYSTGPEEQVVVWRLQTLAAAHDIQVYVPYRPERTGFRPTAEPQLSQEATNAIDAAGCVLAIITSRVAPVVQQELSYALGKGKPVIPIVQAGVRDGSLLSMFPQVFVYSPAGNTGEVESQIIEFLKQWKLSKENQQAITALVAVGLGMLLLSGLSKK